MCVLRASSNRVSSIETPRGLCGALFLERTQPVLGINGKFQLAIDTNGATSHHTPLRRCSPSVVVPTPAPFPARSPVGACFGIEDFSALQFMCPCLSNSNVRPLKQFPLKTITSFHTPHTHASKPNAPGDAHFEDACILSHASSFDKVLHVSRQLAHRE